MRVPALIAWRVSIFLLLSPLAPIPLTHADIPDAISGQDAPLPPEAGVLLIGDRDAFDRLAAGSDAPGALQRSEVKFLITDILTDSPKLYFIDSNAYEYHWVFFGEALGWHLDLLSFNTRTYTDLNRRLIAGSVIANDRYTLRDSVSGIYTIEFWPSDPIHAGDAELAIRLVRSGMAFAADRLLYHPIGETQVRIYLEERERFDAAGVSVILTSDLFKGVDYAALNTGEACGILRDGASSGTFSAGDIVVFRSIPNDIGHVAGIITTIPQTPLSHINLQAMQNATPNVYIPGFADSPEFRSLLGRPVRLTALPDGFTLEEIASAEALEWLDSVRPDSVTTLDRELAERGIRQLEEIRLADSRVYGAKAAGIGELSSCLPASAVPRGCAVPFSYYHEFMANNGFYAAVDSMIASDGFHQSGELREEMLSDLRSRIMDGELPGWMMDSLSAMTAGFEPGTSLRCRSSTNNEDLPGFNGAGLYSSFTHHPDEGDVSETIRKVWAGIWTFRAFEEREYHRIDHLSAAMGVLIHPSYRGELANGVAVTRNIFNPFITGFYVNVQVGEDMVTNPDSESVPEEFLITEQNITGVVTREIQYIGFSNRVPEGGRVLSEEQIGLLDDYLGRIHRHFARVFGADPTSPDFAMEIEFKITAEGALVVKQARPWVSGG
jgi:hypothetical protein